MRLGGAWRWFNRRSGPPWMLLVGSILTPILDWIGRAETVLRVATAIGLPGAPSLVWLVPGVVAVSWLLYVVGRPTPLPAWSEYYALGVRWGIKGDASGSFEVMGPYCPNSGHGHLLRLRTASGVRDFTLSDLVNVAADVLCCPACGGSYALDSRPGVVRGINEARANVGKSVRGAEMARWLLVSLLVRQYLVSGSSLAGRD